MTVSQALLAEHRRRAEARLTEVAGDATLCVIGRSGESLPGVKYLEGAAAALMEVHRRSRVEPIADAVAITTETWRRAAAVARDRLGTDWIAYRQGGLDELEALARVEDTELDPEI